MRFIGEAARRNAKRRGAAWLAIVPLFGAGCFQSKTNAGDVAAAANGYVPQGAAPASAPHAMASATSPAGVTANADTEKTGDKADDIGLPVYPNAKPVQSVAKASDDLTSGGGGVQIALYETPDTPEQALAFYKDKMPSAQPGKEMRDGIESQTLSETPDVNGVRRVQVFRENGKTQIALVRVRPLSSADTPPSATPGVPATGSASGSAAPSGASALPGGALRDSRRGGRRRSRRRRG